MMKTWLLVILALVATTTAQANERDREYSIGGAGGFLSYSPWAEERFKNALDFLGSRLGLWGRYHFAFPDAGMELAFDHLDFAGNRGLKANVYTGALFWRGLPAKSWHPYFAVGAGIAQVEGFFTSSIYNRHFSTFKVRMGVEVEWNPQMELGFYVDHFTILKTTQADPNIHGYAPSLGITYYFLPSRPLIQAAPPPPRK